MTFYECKEFCKSRLSLIGQKSSQGLPITNIIPAPADSYNFNKYLMSVSRNENKNIEILPENPDANSFSPLILYGKPPVMHYSWYFDEYKENVLAEEMEMAM